MHDQTFSQSAKRALAIGGAGDAEVFWFEKERHTRRIGQLVIASALVNTVHPHIWRCVLLPYTCPPPFAGHGRALPC
jgi:hypothetical protein